MKLIVDLDSYLNEVEELRNNVKNLLIKTASNENFDFIYSIQKYHTQLMEFRSFILNNQNLNEELKQKLFNLNNSLNGLMNER